MSIESAKAFIERMKTDEEFNKTVGEIATAEERMEYVKKAGFGFTKEELEEVSAVLTEDELNGISGGNDECPEIPVQCQPYLGVYYN